MDLVNKIIQNKLYLACLKKIEELEKERIFCKHDMNHFLGVARIAYIINLEYQLNFDKEIIYATALLHDIGRHEQYLNHIPHEEAGIKISIKILKQCACKEEIIGQIVEAIASHRKLEDEKELSLKTIIYKADKLSRNCFACKAVETCNWDQAKKNRSIVI